MQEKKMTNCPACQKPVLNDGQFTAFSQFNMRCPWCQSTICVTVKPQIVAELIRTAGQASATESQQPVAKRFKLIGYAYPENQEEKTGG